MITKKHSGFTVLEFLIVLAIISILIAIALAGLGRSREKAQDEKAVSELRVLALGLEEFHQACGNYPQLLSPNEVCDGVDGNKSLNDFIPELQKYQDDINFKYAPLTYEQGSDDCIGFQVAVQLKNVTDPIKTGDQNFNGTDPINNVFQCGSISGVQQPFNGNDQGLFDMHR